SANGFKRALLERPGRIAGHDRARRHVPGNDASRANHGVLADGDAAEQHRAGANGGAPANHRRNAGPVSFRLQGAGGVRGAREAVVDECDIVADEDFVLDRHAFTDEGVAGDLATVADLDTLLNFNECPDLDVVPELTTVKVGEIEDADVFAELNVGGDVAMLGLAHVYNA